MDPRLQRRRVHLRKALFPRLLYRKPRFSCISHLQRTAMGTRKEAMVDPSSHNHNHSNPQHLRPQSRYHVNVLEQRRRRHHPRLQQLPRTSQLLLHLAHIPTLNTPTPIPTTCHHPTACLPTSIHPLLLLDLELDKTQTQLHPCPPLHLILIRTHTPNSPMGIHPLNLHLQATNLHHLRRPDTMFLTRLTRDRRLFRRRLDPMGSNRLT